MYKHIIKESYRRIVSVTTVGLDIFVTESFLSLANRLEILLANEEQAKLQSEKNKLLHENSADVIQTTPTKMKSLIVDKSDERFAVLSMNYEKEQKTLKESIPEMKEQLNAEKDKSEGLQRFINMAKKLTHITELTPEILHEFIEKIVVSAPTKINGKRYQQVDIYYNGVGIIKEPSPEQMEEYFQKHILNDNQKQKSA